MAKAILFSKDQIVGITELQRNAGAVASKAKKNDIFVMKNNVPNVVLIDFDRYEKLVEKAEQAEIFEMMQERKKNPVWYSTDEVFEGLSLFDRGNADGNNESSRKGTASKE